MSSLNQARNRIALLLALFCCLSFVKIPDAFAISNACNVSINKSRIDVSSWSTESFTITTSPNQFWLESFPINCTTTINGSWFDTATFNSTYDFGKSKDSNMVENIFMFGGSLREGSNEIKSCSTSISDICSRTYITGFKKIEVPGYVPPKINAPQITPNSVSLKNICIKPTSFTNKECETTSEMKWTYDSCWQIGAGTAKIQIWSKSKKRFIQLKNTKVKKSQTCQASDPLFPMGVKFTITEKDTKNKTYRIYFPASKKYSATEEKIKVTFE